MFSDEIIAVIAKAIQSEVAHPLGAMRHLPASEEQVALTVLNALDEAGFDVASREQLRLTNVCKGWKADISPVGFSRAVASAA